MAAFRPYTFDSYNLRLQVESEFRYNEITFGKT